MKLRNVLVVGLLVGSAIGVGSAVIAGPPAADWIGPDGRDIKANVPAEIDLLDCQGNVVGKRSNPFADDAPGWTPPAAKARPGHAACERGGGLTVEGSSEPTGPTEEAP